ncbi:hypothetical protein [Streptomyces canus]|uniref:hypothetical protein n=1 Tax=Streptomyces canus TaxID=58343 RepID=UPI00131C8C91|nr:hypothetical protein [Streptomyces canus]
MPAQTPLDCGADLRQGRFVEAFAPKLEAVQRLDGLGGRSLGSGVIAAACWVLWQKR